MNLLSDIWFQVIRHMRTQIRMRVWILINLIQPIIWLVLFTQVFKSLANLPGFEGVSYLQFFAPVPGGGTRGVVNSPRVPTWK